MSNGSQLAIFGSNPLYVETDKGISLAGSTASLAAQYGKTMVDVEAQRDSMPHVKDKKTGEMRKVSRAVACKTLLINSKLATETQIKEAYKAYDQNRNAAIQSNHNHNVLLAANPELKKMLRAYKNGKGDITRIVTTYTKASAGLSKQAQIEALKAQVKQLVAAQAKATVVAALPQGEGVPF